MQVYKQWIVYRNDRFSWNYTIFRRDFEKRYSRLSISNGLYNRAIYCKPTLLSLHFDLSRARVSINISLKLITFCYYLSI